LEASEIAQVLSGRETIHLPPGVQGRPRDHVVEGQFHVTEMAFFYQQLPDATQQRRTAD
jgi:hypothetical protein